MDSQREMLSSVLAGADDHLDTLQRHLVNVRQLADDVRSGYRFSMHYDDLTLECHYQPNCSFLAVRAIFGPFTLNRYCPYFYKFFRSAVCLSVGPWCTSIG